MGSSRAIEPVVRMGCTGGAIEPGVQMGSSRAIEPVLRMGAYCHRAGRRVDPRSSASFRQFPPVSASFRQFPPGCPAPRCRPVVQTFACNDDEQRCAAYCLVGLPRGTFWGAPPEGAWA